MWIRTILLVIMGFSGGMVVAGGSFALIMALGVITRFAGRTHTAKHVVAYENAAVLGGILGAVQSVYLFPTPFGIAGALLFGLFSGVFSGAWAMALTEILDVIPIFSRRIGLKKGMAALITMMALGRTAGALVYYYYRW